MSAIKTGPTQKSATLDIVLSNFSGNTTSVSTNAPLESETDTVSDHRIVHVVAKLPKQKKFSWEVHEYMKITEEGNAELKAKIESEEWQSVKSLAPNNHDMALEFQRILMNYVRDCYEWKKVRRKSSDKPWISDALCQKMK